MFDENLADYFRQMGKIPLLTKEEEEKYGMEMANNLQSLIDGMLELESTWKGVLGLWSEYKTDGKPTNKLSGS